MIAAAPLIVSLSSILTGIGNTLADAAVAVGVLGELRFGNVAGIVLKIKLADAIERAANAELEMQRLKAQFAGRHVLPEQHEKIVGAIRDKAAMLDVIIEYERGDAEAFSYLQEIANVFADAGVAEIRYDANSFLGPGYFGLYAAAAPEIDATTIINAFAKAGMPLTIQTMDLSKHLSQNLRAPNLYIFVAPKLPLPMVAMRAKWESNL